MPLYVYHCESCGRATEDMRKVEDRHNPKACYFCGKPATLEVTTVAFDGKMGLDRDFATLSSKWDKRHYKSSKQ